MGLSPPRGPRGPARCRVSGSGPPRTTRALAIALVALLGLAPGVGARDCCHVRGDFWDSLSDDSTDPSGHGEHAAAGEAARVRAPRWRG